VRDLSNNKQLYYVLWAVVFLFIIVLVGYVFSLRSQLNDQTNTEAALKADQQFIQSFFSYQSTNQRYEQIKPLVTEKGYRAAHPSSMGLLQSDNSVKSSIEELSLYGKTISQKQVEYLNQFKVTTSFNNIGNTQAIIVRTVLTLTESGWMVDDFEFVSDLGAQQKEQ
jgi:hypothetical protein